MVEQPKVSCQSKHSQILILFFPKFHKYFQKILMIFFFFPPEMEKFGSSSAAITEKDRKDSLFLRETLHSLHMH